MTTYIDIKTDEYKSNNCKQIERKMLNDHGKLH